VKTSLKIACLSTFLVVASHLPLAQAGPSGAIFTTIVNGTIVNANTQYTSKCAVYLDGGPGANGNTGAAGLPAGYYYFQVTDPSGKTLLNTDPVSNREFLVSTSGVITAYTGTGGPPHPTGIDLPQSAVGAITVGLANVNCPADFLDTSNNGGEYKAWATPVSSFVGDPTQVDNPCGPDCFHGFQRSESKTDNFKVKAESATFCLLVTKQVLSAGGTITAGVAWPMTLTDPSGTTTSYVTNSAGTLSVCGLAPGSYTLTEAQVVDLVFYVVVSVTVNGVSAPALPSYTFTWAAGDPAPSVIFQNTSGVG
jgi:hypothetical protein